MIYQYFQKLIVLPTTASKTIRFFCANLPNSNLKFLDLRHRERGIILSTFQSTLMLFWTFIKILIAFIKTIKPAF